MSHDTSRMFRVSVDTMIASVQAFGIGALLFVRAIGEAATDVALGLRRLGGRGSQVSK